MPATVEALLCLVSAAILDWASRVLSGELLGLMLGDERIDHFA